MLSIIVPAYNEKVNIGATILRLVSQLNREETDYEIVIIDDGSPDGTFSVARNYHSDKVRIFGYPQNRGKGHALKHGFSKSRGETIVFLDAGLDFPTHLITQFAALLELHGADVVIGSKRHPQSKVNYPTYRRIVSFFGQRLIKLLFNLNVTDTQVGLKAFRREVLEEVLPLTMVRRYAFDIELLVLAHSRQHKVLEAPVELDLKFSTAASLKSIWMTFIDTCAIFYRLKIIKFYDEERVVRDYLLKNYPTILIDKIVYWLSRPAEKIDKLRKRKKKTKRPNA